jgi:hypothetical protein
MLLVHFKSSYMGREYEGSELNGNNKSLNSIWYCDMTPESRNSRLIDNVSVNTISRLLNQQWDLHCIVVRFVATDKTQIITEWQLLEVVRYSRSQKKEDTW